MVHLQQYPITRATTEHLNPNLTRRLTRNCALNRQVYMLAGHCL